MDRRMWLLEKLRYVNEQVEFEVFYSIQYYPRRGELTLQGEISIAAVKVAKHFNVPLSYNEDTGNMVGENEDGSLRIVLTD
jgi:hypothetical protein